ncbi:hypothetical protein HOS75_gp032 [Gordonia phage SteveFrench]|uniref:Uncharacterized protein n=2 Tax=Montyvirus stevefrench TaxID=2734258 RepID=A0A890V3K1_9CAUD|nr:hypothetical protein HOS75_gp032 [Gordonia phage SteveFrench]AUV60698.1 hypothetical protein SEA_STEVEFRENCH_96 [Gordonia phage SteveFrench]QOP65428.1 hypothetical protein SEA_DIABLA_102 [Gordonia phage Diabla]QRI45681.1 hypothetical protein SEA_ROYALG_97 [Gordonia phage RoyalG]
MSISYDHPKRRPVTRYRVNLVKRVSLVKFLGARG